MECAGVTLTGIRAFAELTGLLGAKEDLGLLEELGPSPPPATFMLTEVRNVCCLSGCLEVEATGSTARREGRAASL